MHLTDTEPTLGYAFGAFGPVFVTPQALPPAVAGELSASLVITSDVSPSTVERIRDAFPPGVLATTIQEQASFAARVYDGYVRAVVLGLVMAITVGAASLAVSTADSARERRRSTAALVAIGVLLRTVRRAVLLQMAAPMLTNVLLALGAAAAASTLYLDIYAGNGVARTPLP